MAGQGIKVLIVEDREDHAVLIRALIDEALGDSVTGIDHADTAPQGMECLERGDYDICLLDYDLGNNQDGISFLEQVSQSEDINTPIVFLTSMGDEAIAVQAMKAGAKDYLRKEALSPEGLRSTIRHALELHREELLRVEAQAALREAKEQLEAKVQELNEANDHLLRLGRLKDEFVASISHELRTPITNLKLSQQLLIAHPVERDTYLATMRRETERLHFIIEDLLDVARMAQQPVPPDATTVDLNTLVLLYVADRTLMAEERGLSLTFEEEPGLSRIKADPMQLERVLGILVMNAIYYTPEGGQIVVSTASERTDGQLWAGFCVKDTGLGIAEDEQPRLFERFFRGQAARERGVPGTGLGLSMAKQIVEQHDGRIEVDSPGAAGQGAMFRVWLPVEENQEKNAKSNSKGAGEPVKHSRSKE